MPNTRSPRHGSMQFWPRKRAKRIYPRVQSWPTSSENKPLGFYGYKVQMMHGIVEEFRPDYKKKGGKVSIPMTLIECPPLKVAAIRFYKNTEHGPIVGKDIFVSNDSLLAKKLLLPKTLPNLDKVNVDEYDDLTLVCYTQSHLTTRGQKKPEVFEIALGGKYEEKVAYAKEHKEIKISDVFGEGDQLDILGVTKGLGFQGVVKRFGVKIKAAKSEKKKRSVGNLGPWHPAHTAHTVAQGGKMGFHNRTDQNKWLLKISNEDINPIGGFKRYGLVKNEYILVKGSVPGTTKRMVRLLKSKRPRKNIPKEAPQLEVIVS